MRYLFIVVNLETQKVEMSSNIQSEAMEYISSHSGALYLIRVKIDKQYPCMMGLDGCAY